MLRCQYCGVQLTECLNGWFCPNHGIVIEKETEEDRKNKNGKE